MEFSFNVPFDKAESPPMVRDPVTKKWYMPMVPVYSAEQYAALGDEIETVLGAQHRPRQRSRRHALAAGDISLALEHVGKLPPSARQAMQGWIQQAQALLAARAALRQLVADMAETMYEAPGIGLAATQVNVHQRVIVIDVSEDQKGLQAFINPVIESVSGMQTYEEGCLSVPGVYDKVDRPSDVRVRYQDLDGKEHVLETGELLAICIQHEIDHLNGKVFVDHLSQLKQTRIKNKLAKLARQNV